MRGVNALTRATLISTQMQRQHMSESRTVSMPSHGQHSFLQDDEFSDGEFNEKCQCPHTGNTHFYDGNVGNSESGKLVSMPSHGQHSFLLYPLKCPCFMRIIDPIFAGNSQNILKKTFFRGFTCMFTVCSYLKFLFEPF